MIEKYDAAHLKTQLDASAINIMKPRPKKEMPGTARDERQSVAWLAMRRSSWLACMIGLWTIDRAGVAKWQTQRT